MNPVTTFVVTQGLDIGSPIAAGLVSGGARVAWLSDGSVPAVVELDAAVARVHVSMASRAGVESAFALAQAQTGRPSQVVVSAIPRAGLQAREVGDLTDDDWRAACGAAMKGVLYALQAACTALAEQGGSVVVIGPSLSLAGAGHLVALSTAIEGQRGLVKSTARQWGQRGITVNWIAAAPRGLSPAFEGLPLPVKPDAVRVALGRPLSLAGEIAPVIQFLASPAGRCVTGATLVLDGGEWMVP
jgi:NAD(P)-dependent dehydrogenase (short-subunit alcohol dehydrogenase family)